MMKMFNSFRKNFKIVGFVFRFCPGYKYFTILFIIASLLNSVSKVFLIQKAIELFVKESPFGEFASAIAVYLIVILVTAFIRIFYRGYISGKYRLVYINKMRDYMYRLAHRIDYADFDNPDFYDQYARALRDGASRGILVYEDLAGFVSSLLNTFAVGSIILITDWMLVLIIIFASICSFILKNIINRKWYLHDKATEKNRRMYRYLNRTFYRQRYAAEIKTTPVSGLLVDKYKETAADINKAYLRTQRGVVLYDALLNFVETGIEQGGTYLFLGYKLFFGLIDISRFGSVLNAAIQFSGNFTNVMNFITRIKQNALYIDDFFWYLEYEPGLETRGREALLASPETIDVDRVYFRYPESGDFVLRDFLLTIKKGEKLAIVGLNGSGKTTLVKLLLKFYLPVKGKILFDNQDYAMFFEKDVRRQFAVIFQDFEIYALSVAENILMRRAESAEDEKRVWDALEMVGMREKVASMPDGINTQVTREFHRRGAVFSGGEQQKLAIARVFASDADIYVLDEPTSSLDPLSEKQINDLIIEKARDKTIIIIAHRLSTVVDVDRIILIEDHKIKEMGTHRELIARGERYRKLFATQASLYKKASR